MGCGGCIMKGLAWSNPMLWGVMALEELGVGPSAAWREFKHLMIPDMRRDREVMTNSAATARRIVYGHCRVSGQVAYAQTTGEQNETLHLIILLAGHPVTGFGEVWLDNWTLTDINRNPLTKALTTVQLYDGTQTTACASLVAESGGRWTADHKLLGCAYAYLRLIYNESLWTSGIPSVKFEIRGREIYDPRTDTTAWSDNPALCAYDYMMLPTYYGGMGCLEGEVDVASVIAAADICDELVASSKAGDTEKRYTCNGTMTVESTPKTLLEAVLQSMVGDAVYVGGVWRIYAGAYSEPAATIDETWLNGGFSFTLGAPKNNRINLLTGTYVDPADKWGVKGFAAVTDPSFVAEDTGEELKKDLTLNFTTSEPMARRIAKILLRRSRLGTAVDYPCNLKAFELNAWDVVAVNNDILGWSGQTFRIGAWGFAPQAGVTLSLIEESPWVYEWGVDDFGPVATSVAPELPDLTWRHQTVLPDVTLLRAIYQGRQLWLAWSAVAAFDPVRYEIRYGDYYDQAVVLGTTTDTLYPTISDGTYWVTAVTNWGRSATPATIVLSNSTLAANVVQMWDEPGTGWSGTLAGGAEIDGGNRLWLKTTGGEVVSPGSYEQPAGHIVDIGSVQDCTCYCLLTSALDSPLATLNDVADVDAITSWDGTYNGEAGVTVEIDTSQDASTWDGWQTLTPGPYRARRFKFRLVLTSSAPDITVAVSQFSTIVDMPDRSEPFTNQAIAAGGTALTYSKPFQAVPNVQVTILNSQSGDYVSVTGSTAAGCTVQILNGGTGVGRTCNIIAQGY